MKNLKLLPILTALREQALARFAVVEKWLAARMTTDAATKDDSLISVAPYTILFTCLTITVIAGFYIHSDVSREETRRFGEISGQIHDRIHARLERHEDTLIHTRGFFNASNKVSRREFREFFQNMNLAERYPGFQAVGFTERLTRRRMMEQSRQLRRSGYPKYMVWPTYPRNEYFVVTYIEPFDWRNQRAFGFDMGTEPGHRQAMEDDRGRPTLSRRVTLVQETTEKVQPGFLMFVPVYRHRNIPATLEARRRDIRGFIYTPFRGRDLFEKIFDESSYASRAVQFEVYDGAKPTAQSLLYDSNAQMDFGGRGRPDYEAAIPLEIAGHRWTIYVSTLPGFTLRTSRYATVFVIFAGVIMSLLLFWVLMAVKRQADSERRRLEEEQAARARGERLASDLQRALLERDNSLETLETINRVGRLISGQLYL